MGTTEGRVRAAYDSNPAREWNRLTTGAQNRLEFVVTTYALERHLPPLDRPRRILDAGGGPGRYALLLAERGYTVTLLDLSPALLAFARQRIAEAAPDARARIEAAVEGSIVDLAQFADGTFDAVLCLGGPLSHVLDPAERMTAVRELRRVAGPGAPIFIAVMNRIGLFRSAVMWPGSFDDLLPLLSETGIHTIGSGQAPTFAFWPEEFTSLLTDSGLAIERLCGTNGIGAHLQEGNLLALLDDPVRWPI